MSLETNGRTLYVLRSGLAGIHPLVVSRVVCNSVQELNGLRAKNGAADVTVPLVCVGPPDQAFRALDKGVSATSALKEVSVDVEAIVRVQPRPIVLLETIPSALCNSPAVQDWSGAQRTALAAYELAESYNEGLRAIAAAHGIWLLDCDRAVARSGSDSGAPVDIQAIEREFYKIMSEALGWSSKLGMEAGDN